MLHAVAHHAGMVGGYAGAQVARTMASIACDCARAWQAPAHTCPACDALEHALPVYATQTHSPCWRSTWRPLCTTLSTWGAPTVRQGCSSRASLGTQAPWLHARSHEHGCAAAFLAEDFLINTLDPLAIRYNDRAPMENHHLAATVRTVLCMLGARHHRGTGWPEPRPSADA